MDALTASSAVHCRGRGRVFDGISPRAAVAAALWIGKRPKYRRQRHTCDRIVDFRAPFLDGAV